MTDFDPLQVSFTTRHVGTPAASTDTIGEMVSWTLSRGLRGGTKLADRKLAFQFPDDRISDVEVSGNCTGTEPTISASHARARAFWVKPLADGDLIGALREYDGARNESDMSKKRFVRDSSRLAAAAEKAASLSAPTILISQFQLPDPFSFGGGPPDPERPLRSLATAAAHRVARYLPPHVRYLKAACEAIELGDYTTHDPDTLHPRFLEYVHDRVTSVPERTDDSMRIATEALGTLWNGLFPAPRARDMADVEPGRLRPLLNNGSPGEYRLLGAAERLDDRLVDTMAASLARYSSAANTTLKTGKAPSWTDTTTQPVLTFGKKEPKAAKVRDGKRLTPVPRFIFNVSPINYALAVFLHGDLSKQLQALDPTHGPGFGPGRGRAGVFLSVLEKATNGGFFNHHGTFSMSDIEKWDANMCEALLGYSFDLLESAVDKSHLTDHARAARALMVKVARRQLMEKLVEHPSGYLVWLFGCMPSGSYYTSLINTIGNDLLVLGHIADQAVHEKNMRREDVVSYLASNVAGTLVSYGDNQLISEQLFTGLGLRYDPVAHAEFLSRFGMKLKVEETEVSPWLSRARFCSRGAVRTPYGLLITRSHDAIYQKLAGRPRHDPVIDKLYVRALMADYMGTDPIAYEVLAAVDSMVDADLSEVGLTPAVKLVLTDAAKSFYGEASDEALMEVLKGLSTSRLDRRALLSLHTPRQAGGGGVQKLGFALQLGGEFLTYLLTPAAEWVADLGPKEWVDYLQATHQLSVITDTRDDEGGE
ncbi:RNA dependent RNA polymerase [Diplodia seriata polymycovirus 1]|nr:RNA dependent RNA polymerase [Diplodia seriata polymycovirus 1]